MHNRQISKSTQIKVLKFIEHVQEKEKENPINGQLILKKVSKNLKQQVHIEYFGNILKQSKLFKLTFSQAFLDELITHMNEVLFSPDEVIFNSSKSTENILYFLVDGSVGVYSNFNTSENKLIEVISKKRFVGLTWFFSEQQDENLVLKTHETSLIVSLLHKDFIKCISNFPTDLEKYHNIKQNVIDSSKRLEQCSSCGEFTHTVQKCHLLHLSLNTQLIKSKYQFSQSQLLRDSTKKRLKKIKINSLFMNKSVRKKVRMIRSNLILESRGHQQLDGSICSDELEFETDHHFLKRVAQIKYSQNQLQTLSDLNVTGEESNNSSITSDSDENNSNDSRYNFTHIKSNSYNQIQEMEEEYGAEEIEEQNNQKRKNYFSKKHQSFQSENSQPKRLSNLLSPSNANYQKRTKRSHQGSDTESNENIQSRFDLTRSAANLEQGNTVQSNNYFNEFQMPQKSKNDKLQKEKKGKKRKSNEKQNNQNYKEIPYKSNSLPKNTQVTMFKAQPLKSNSLPRNQPHLTVKREQLLKSYSLPRDNNTETNQADSSIKRKPYRYSVEEQQQYNQTNDNGCECENNDLNSSLLKSGNESSLYSNHQNNQQSVESIHIHHQQVPILKISYAPPLLSNNLVNNLIEEIPVSSRKQQEEVDIKINYTPNNEKNINQQSNEDLYASIIFPDNVSQFNKEQKTNQSNTIADQTKSQGFFNTENGNNQSIRNQTDFPTTLPTNQDDYNYTDQFFINLNNNPTQQSEYLDVVQPRQKSNTHTLNIFNKNENQQNYRSQNSEKKNENNYFEDKTNSGGKINSNNFLKTPDSHIIPSLNIDQRQQYQVSEAQIQELSKSGEVKSIQHNLTIPQNKHQQLTKLRTFDEKTDKLKKKVTKKSTLEFELEPDLTQKGEKIGIKKKLDQLIPQSDKKQQLNKLNGNTNSRDKRNTYLNSQLKRRRSFRGDAAEGEGAQAVQGSIQPNLDLNTLLQQQNVKLIKSINIIYDDSSPISNQQKENNTQNQNNYFLKKSSIKGINNTLPQNTFKNYITLNAPSNNNHSNINNNFSSAYNAPPILNNNQNNNTNLQDEQNKQNKRTSITLHQPKTSIILDDHQISSYNMIKNSSTNIQQQQNTFVQFQFSQSQAIKAKDALFIYDFDQGKEWQYYLPHNNQSHVIKEIKKNQRQLAQRQKVQKPRMQIIAKQIMNKKRLTGLLNNLTISALAQNQ